MKAIIKLLIVSAVYGQFFLTNMRGEGNCETCVPGNDTCLRNTSGGGQCDWEGGLICTGSGSCPLDSGVAPDLSNKDAKCEYDSNPESSCQLSNNREIWTSKCAVYCRIIPFVSCHCLKTGARNGQFYYYFAKECL